MLPKKVLFVVFFVGLPFFSQTSDKLNHNVLKNGTLIQQFDYVDEKSSTYKDYKVVKKEFLTHLKKGSLDSISKLKQSLFDLQSSQIKNSNKISLLQRQNFQLKTTIQEVTEQKNQIGFMGLSLHKTTFAIVIYSIIGLLIFMIVLLFLKIRLALHDSNKAYSTLVKVESEFEEFRKRALEKEQILGRRLQDEINKQKRAKK